VRAGARRKVSDRKCSGQWLIIGGGGGVAVGATAGARPGPTGTVRGTGSDLVAFRCIGGFAPKMGSIRVGQFRASKPNMRYDGTTAATVRTEPPQSEMEGRNANSSCAGFSMGRTGNSHLALRTAHLSSGVIFWNRSMSILQGGGLPEILSPDVIRRTVRTPQSGIAPTPSIE